MNRETHEKHENVLYREECYVIQGAIFEVYKEMGCGFLEAVYQECLELELRNREAKKHLYDYVIYDSTNERDFAAELEAHSREVEIYVKLPRGFYISTPWVNTTPTGLSHFMKAR